MILTIFGYAKTGKTLLFNLLTDQHEEVSKFAASASEFHKAVVDIPDPRLQKLAQHFELPPVAAKIEYLDAGAISFGDVSNTTFIDLLRRADGLVHVARGFEDAEIFHPKESIDPIRDIHTMEEELKAADFLTIEKRLERLKTDLMKMKSKDLVEENELLHRLKEFLEAEKPLREFPFNSHEDLLVRGFKFLSQKPLLNIINSDETSYTTYLKEKSLPEKNKACLVFSGKIEQELLELEPEDREIFQREYGLENYQYIREIFITESYRLMNLISFFSVGKSEVRAWTIPQDNTALLAAGKIHQDIQQGFIRAEVIGSQEFFSCGGFGPAKEKGLLRLEGKDYQIKDGEIIYFRFNK